MPFPGAEKQMRFNVMNKTPEFTDQAWKECSNDVKDLVLDLLTKDQNWRLDVTDILSQKWFS